MEANPQAQLIMLLRAANGFGIFKLSATDRPLPQLSVPIRPKRREIRFLTKDA